MFGGAATLEHVSVNSRDSCGASPLHVAAECNQPKAATFLMRHCAFVDALDASGRSYAAPHGYTCSNTCDDRQMGRSRTDRRAQTPAMTGR